MTDDRARTERVERALAALIALVGRVGDASQQLTAAGASPAPDADLPAISEATRRSAAAELDAVEAQLGQLDPRALGGLDLAQFTGALRVFGDWLRAPSPAGEAAARTAMAELQQALGPQLGWDPAREDAARRAQYRREARAALDDFFVGKPGKA